MTSFEEQLTLSAPQVPLHGAELNRELLLVNASVEDMATSSRPRPRRRRLALGAFGVIGVGVGAAGVVPLTFSLTKLILQH